jgi:hypothetical protein
MYVKVDLLKRRLVMDLFGEFIIGQNCQLSLLLLKLFELFLSMLGVCKHADLPLDLFATSMRE